MYIRDVCHKKRVPMARERFPGEVLLARFFVLLSRARSFKRVFDIFKNSDVKYILIVICDCFILRVTLYFRSLLLEIFLLLKRNYTLLVCTLLAKTSRIFISVLVVRYSGNRDFEHGCLIFAQIVAIFRDRSIRCTRQILTSSNERR